jgi:uncharacterized protein
MRVFVTGGTGLIGSRLIRSLHQRRDMVTLLSRRPEAARATMGAECAIVAGDPTQPGPWMEAVDDCDAVVNLAGENLFTKRWNATFKRVLRDSRINSTQNVVDDRSRSTRSREGRESRVPVGRKARWPGDTPSPPPRSV